MNPHTDTAQTLYEGDQSKLYSGVLAHHSPSELQGDASRTQIRRIMKVTLILSVVTIIEVGLGLYGHYQGLPVGIRNFFFILMTLLKAAYIVRVFMHLGDEFRSFLITILMPMFLFIWFIIAFLYDGNFWLKMNSSDPTRAHQNKTQVQQPDPKHAPTDGNKVKID